MEKMLWITMALAVYTKTHHIFLPTAEYGATPEPTTDNPRP